MGKIDVRSDASRYEALFAHAPLGMARIDLDGTILEVNAALVRRSGYASEELAGHSIADFLAVPDLAGTMLAELRAGKPAAREAALIDREGRHVPRSIVFVPAYDAQTVAGGFIIISDISAQVEAQQRVRSLFEQHPHGIASLDERGRILDVNDALLQLGGYTRAELIGAHFLDFASKASLPDARRVLERTLSGESQTHDLHPRRKDGSSANVHCTTIPVRIDGAVRGAYLVLEDIELRRRQAALLQESEERFRSLFAQNPDPILALDRSGRVLDVNDALLAVLAYRREDVLGRNFGEFLAPEELAYVLPHRERVLAGEAVTYEFRYRGAGSREFVFMVTSFPMLSAGEIIGSYAVLLDTTKEREARDRADAHERRIRELYHIAATSSATDAQLSAMLWAGCRLLQMDLAAIADCGGTPRIERSAGSDSLRDEDAAALLALATESAASGEPVVVSRRSENGHTHFSRAIAVPLAVAGQAYGAVCFASRAGGQTLFEETDRDLVALISALLGGALERRRSRANLKTLAYFDTLTGLPNRAYVQDRLRDAIERAQSSMRRVALAIFDLDHFKDVNDTLGHALGDRLLQLAAGRFVETVRDRGTVARMGGDEFAVLLTRCETVDEVREAVKEILDAVDSSFHLDEYEQFVTASAGVSIYPDDGKDDQALIKNADIAMYRAKDRGPNAFELYAPSLEAPIEMRLSQQKLLRRALENEEFVVYYQPQVDMINGRIAALEALVRWNDPKSGIIFPGRFIPSAEVSGLIVPLGNFVLRTATQQLARWRTAYPDLRIAVNLSAKQFHQPDLRAHILDAVRSAGLGPEALEMEITESVAMTDAAHSVQIMRDLVDAGVRIGLDDFGTGYSSLTYLRRFPAAVLKIDRSFVAGIGNEANDETIVITVIAMAHNLGLEVVAEGVETAQQYDFLRTYGCDRVQGYYISPAVPVSGIEALLGEWRPLER